MMCGGTERISGQYLRYVYVSNPGLFEYYRVEGLLQETNGSRLLIQPITYVVFEGQIHFWREINGRSILCCASCSRSRLDAKFRFDKVSVLLLMWQNDDLPGQMDIFMETISFQMHYHDQVRRSARCHGKFS